MEEAKLRSILNERIRDFGDKQAYVLYQNELEAGITHAILTIKKSENRGDGTTVIEATFEGKKFLCVTEEK